MLGATQEDDQDDRTLDDVDVPPAPWRAQGVAWAGLFRASGATTAPALAPLLGAGWKIVGLARYLDGSTLTYDEVIVGALVRHGLRAGLLIESIYVNSLASLWGGRRIWGLPKELATFTWSDDGCAIHDSHGPLLTIRAPRSAGWTPPLPGVIGAFGRLDARWAYLRASGTARVRPVTLRLEVAPGRFPFRLASRSLLGIACASFQACFPAPTLFGRAS